MLDLSHEPNVSGLPWESAELAARLPGKMTDFFEKEGPLPVRLNCRRAYRRFYLRGKAILRCGNDTYGVYTVDASRMGIGFFAPIQLLPKLHVMLQLPNVKEFEVEVVRCCRLEQNCYHCGAIFIRGI